MPEKENETTAQVSSNPEIDTAQAIEKLQAQIESLKTENDNLKEVKREYFDKVLNSSGETPTEEKHRPIDEIRKDIVNGVHSDNMSNLDYCKLIIELDDETRRTKGHSAFLPQGKDVNPTVDEYATADKLNSVLKECISQADDDPVQFNMALKAHMPRERK